MTGDYHPGAKNKSAWRGYSETERQAIFDALPAARVGDRAELIDRLISAVVVEELNPRMIVKSARSDATSRIDARMKAIALLEEDLVQECDLAYDDKYRGPISDAAPTVLQTLRIYGKLLQNERHRLHRFADELSEKLPSNRRNFFQDHFFRKVANEWVAAGGTVRYDASYRRFWEAVVHPPFHDEWVKKTYNVALADGTFRAHVATFQNRKKTGQASKLKRHPLIRD